MVKWTPKSEEDLELIVAYISRNFNFDLALETLYSIINFTETTLSSNPLAGKLLESNPFFSQLVYEGNSIFYCENPKDKDLYIVYVQPRQTKFNPKRLNDDEVA